MNTYQQELKALMNEREQLQAIQWQCGFDFNRSYLISQLNLKINALIRSNREKNQY